MPAAFIHAAERRLTRHLRESGAVNANSAQALPDLRGVQRRRLPHLVKKGVVGDVGGRYFLDEDAWDAYRQRQRLIAVGGIMAVLLVMAMVVLLTRSGG